MNRGRIRTRQLNSPRGQRAGGFTLVEMMVVLALTLIMMVLFAQIFQITGTFVTKQKGLGENDQSARILTSVIKNDLEARTMRIVAPFHPSAPAPYPTVAVDGQRQGYFYYSENDPLNDADDVLQFTIDLGRLPPTNPLSNGRLFGLATNLPLPWLPNTTYPPNTAVRPNSSAGTGFIYVNATGGNITSGPNEPSPWSNALPGTTPDGGSNWSTALSAIDQPDGDDGTITIASTGDLTVNPAGGTPNNTGASRFAEVSYWLRRGNLYRRVLLVREPFNRNSTPPTVPATSAPDSQPDDTAFAALIPGQYAPLGPARSFWADFDYAARIQIAGGVATGVRFHAQTPPESSLDNVATGGLPLGSPDNRFGHDQISGLPAAGRPREFDSAGLFFGRYTLEETSSPAFLFPGALPAAGSPMAQTTPATLDPTGAFITQFAGGPRRGEDILLTNVLSFDVKILDNLYSEPPLPGGDFNRNGVQDVGPAPAFADLGHGAPTGVFRLAAINPLSAAYGPNPPLPLGNNVFDTWHPQFDFTGDGVADQPPYSGLPSVASAVAPSVWQPWTPLTAFAVGQIVTPPPADNIFNGLQYVCVSPGTSGAGPNSPFSNNDNISTSTPTLIVDGTCQWVAQSPVRAIQITVKYLDPTQNQLRQVTIVQSLALP